MKLYILKNDYDFFKSLPEEKTTDFLLDIISIGMEYDCNPGEILESLGAQLKFCYYCRETQSKFPTNSDICVECSK